MGVVKNISASSFPKQGRLLGKRTKVCFHYDTSVLFDGRILRDDAESPFVTIIQLDTGVVVLGSECQFMEP
jgi:hypothetical protein